MLVGTHVPLPSLCARMAAYIPLMGWLRNFI